MGFQENHEQDWCACLSFLELSNPWANKKLFHLKWFLSMEKKYQSKIDISKLYILELWKSLVFHFFVFSSLCYGISYKHDEKTKKIGKQRGMKEREQQDWTQHYMIKLQINHSLGLQVGIKQWL